MGEFVENNELARSEVEHLFELRTRFSKIIDTVTEAQQRPNVRPVGVDQYESRGLLEVGGCKITFAKYRGQLFGIDGDPVCGLELSGLRDPNNYRDISVKFVLTESDGWQRNYRERFRQGPFGYNLVTRQLTLEEIQTLVAFSGAPHIRETLLVKLMETNNEERAYLDERYMECMDQERKLYEDLTAMSDARRRAEASSRDIFIV